MQENIALQSKQTHESGTNNLTIMNKQTSEGPCPTQYPWQKLDDLSERRHVGVQLTTNRAPQG